MRLHKALTISTKSSFKNFAIFLIPLSLVLLMDSVMAFSFPLIMERELNSNSPVGLIMAFSSTVGLCIDLILPKIFKNNSWKYLLILGVFLSILFPVLTFSATQNLPIIMFLLASGIWGIYFELISFSQQDFVVSEEKKEVYTRDWGILNSVWEITVVAGIVIGALLLQSEDLDSFLTTQLALGFLALISSFIVLRVKSKRKRIDIKSHISNSISFFKNLLAIKEIANKVLSIIIISITATFVSAVFWTFGGLLGEELSAIGLNKELSWIIIGVYSFATLISSLFISTIQLRNKRSFIEIALLLGGYGLAITIFFENLIVILSLLFLSSLSLAFVRPITDSIFSELSLRRKSNEVYFISLSRITISLSYIIGPIFAGFVSDIFNYKTTFAIAGLIVMIVATYFILKIDKTIRLPEKKILEITTQ